MMPPYTVPAAPPGAVRKIAIASEHASPLAAPGGIDSGGRNVYVAHLAGQLAQAGYLVDIFTRRDAQAQAPLVAWRERIRVIHVPAGPARYVPKEQMLPYMDALARFVTRFARRQRQRYDVVHANFFRSGMVAQYVKRALVGDPAAARAGAGHIVNIASTAAKRAWPNAAAYHASKWGLLGLSHAPHAELRPHRIKVTAVIAGGMRTPFLLDRFPDLDLATLQEPINVAQAVKSALLLPDASVVAEITALPPGETSWP